MSTIQRTVTRTETYTVQETKTGTRSDGMGGTETYTYTEPVQKQRTVSETVTETLPDPVPPAERMLEEAALELEAEAALEAAQEDLHEAGELVETTDPLNLRADPEVGDNRLGTFPPGAELTVQPDAEGRVTEGDWVHVRGTLDGETVTGWVHGDYLRASDEAGEPEQVANAGEPAVVGAGAYAGPEGPTGFIGGNYTDLGIIDGVYDPAAAAADLDRLLAEGVTEVRVWATGVPGYNMEEDPQRAADRIGSLAQLAADRGMTLTVDLFDGQGWPFAELSGAMDDAIDAKIETIVGDNAAFANVRWSLGNEIQGHEAPAAFADWFTDKVGAMRDAAGDHSIHVTTQLVPGSAEHRWWADTEDAARQIVDSVDSVGVHLYPEGPVDSSMGWLEYTSAMQYKRLADAQDKPFVIGEFNVSSVGGARSAETIGAWLDHLHEQGVAHVSLWQLMKDEGGHLDEESFDSLRGNDYLQTLRPWLDAQ